MSSVKSEMKELLDPVYMYVLLKFLVLFRESALAGESALSGDIADITEMESDAWDEATYIVGMVEANPLIADDILFGKKLK